MNSQPPRPVNNTLVLSVKSIFNTIQGEGPFAGEPATFVRLEGCNLMCLGCDTDYTGEAKGPAPIEEAIMASLMPNKLVVVTGGEPFRQPLALSNLIRSLSDRCPDIRIQVETNGTLDCPRIVSNPTNFSIVVSPKIHLVKRTLFPYLVAVKYVVDANFADDSDGLPTLALLHPSRTRVWRQPPELNIPIYLQPEDNENKEANTRYAIETCMKFGYRLSLQQHKILNLQ